MKGESFSRTVTKSVELPQDPDLLYPLFYFLLQTIKAMVP